MSRKPPIPRENSSGKEAVARSVLSSEQPSDKTPAPSSHSQIDSLFGNRNSLGVGSRLLLILIGLFLLAGFGLSAWLSPDPRGHGTHQQLGLAPCSFLLFTGRPCPSCGSTTAFAHFVRGQWPSAIEANVAAFVLAVCCAAGVPWSLASALRGRLLGIGSVERTLLTFVIVMTGLFFGQWVVHLMTYD